MSGGDGFYQAILASVDDDLPRLIYADYLEDCGDAPRAEFLRVQTALARMSADDPRYASAKDREAVLIAAHLRTWRAELPVIDGMEWGRFERGLPYGIHVKYTVDGQRVKDFLEHYAKVRNIAPVAGVWWSGLTDDGARVIANSRSAEFFEDLDFTGLAVAPSAVRILFSAGVHSLKRLRRVEFGDQSGAVIRSLAESGVLSALSSLSARAAGIGDREIHSLCHAHLEHGSNLRTLEFGMNRITDEGVGILARSPMLETLETLSLAGCDIGEAGVNALAASPFVGNLRLLDLGGLSVPDEAFIPLIDSPRLSHLVELNLRTGYRTHGYGSMIRQRNNVRTSAQTTGIGRSPRNATVASGARIVWD